MLLTLTPRGPERYALRPLRPPGDANPPSDPNAGDPTASAVKPQAERHKNPRRRLLCAACGEIVTHEDEAIEIANEHAHVFVNPGGFIYEIRCFGRAPGCTGEGPTTDQWTWFPGYRWQVGVCALCGIQLGWIYRGADQVFFGLIDDRLAASDDP